MCLLEECKLEDVHFHTLHLRITFSNIHFIKKNTFLSIFIKFVLQFTQLLQKVSKKFCKKKNSQIFPQNIQFLSKRFKIRVKKYKSWQKNPIFVKIPTICQIKQIAKHNQYPVLSKIINISHKMPDSCQEKNTSRN